ncbi:hypothetical protein BDA96_09G021800 [Sorghum bicolor]|uniref:Uncharacterized protein n=2 Tax=Sorghum bicolor TaxID=4558 RepID=A0A921QAH8_SORBI|nr:hypothetical protein BDA96_09G021800 [Sorghum bicolor]KXG21145.1 hypothetical protein SORBI_3009G021000 [Sorghum bicolor]
MVGEDLGPFVRQTFTCGRPEPVLASLRGANEAPPGAAWRRSSGRAADGQLGKMPWRASEARAGAVGQCGHTSGRSWRACGCTPICGVARLPPTRSAVRCARAVWRCLWDSWWSGKLHKVRAKAQPGSAG